MRLLSWLGLPQRPKSALSNRGRRKDRNRNALSFTKNDLLTFSQNLWWTWHAPSRAFVDHVAELSGAYPEYNPAALFRSISETELGYLNRDSKCRELFTHIQEDYSRYLAVPTWWNRNASDSTPLRIAFFSAEFAIHESFPIYSGGLGVLAGDIIKSASDLGIAMTGVTLFYREGYFQQLVSPEGWQSEIYPRLDPTQLPITAVTDNGGQLLRVTIPVGDRQVSLAVWKAVIGRCELYLLDTDLPENDHGERAITARLYGGDVENRIRQEIVLGIGGSRALEAMGKPMDLFHLNEGHSAFLSLDQILRFVRKHSLSVEQALAIVRDRQIFTTHTPVPAGNDTFHHELAAHYLAPLAREIDTDVQTLLRLGRMNPHDHHEPFSMSLLGFRTSGSANAVSDLHGRVSRGMWHNMWPGAPVEEVPISHVTNGVHVATWIADEIAELFDSYLGESWREATSESDSWKAVDTIPEAELWAVRTALRRNLIRFVRARRLRQLQHQQLRAGIASDGSEHKLSTVLNPDALTVCFARRFATYKRATLLFRDIARLQRIMSNAERPVQFVFAGKSHPADEQGKSFLAQVAQMTVTPEFHGKIIFLENYDMAIARVLVQGADVWLNTPRRPLEASGTSGMKAALNGSLNLSILDGWWCEGFDGENGWSIGSGEHFDDANYQDEQDNRSLLDRLEEEIIPEFYERRRDGVPERWLRRMKRALRTIIPRYSAERMVTEYATRFYIPHGLTKGR